MYRSHMLLNLKKVSCTRLNILIFVSERENYTSEEKVYWRDSIVIDSGNWRSVSIKPLPTQASDELNVIEII